MAKLRTSNKILIKWLNDVSLRVNINLYSTLILNCIYALFQLWLGVYHRSFWYYALAGYYLFLATMRTFLLRYTRKHKAGENMLSEYIKYRLCGLIFLAVNTVLAIIIFFMIYWGRTFTHHEITTIALATYTFTAFIFAIINLIKYKKYNSPVFSATKAISLAAACVSMLTLTSTMLTSFGKNSDPAFRKLMLALVGSAVSSFIIVMAIHMTVQSTKEIKKIKSKGNTMNENNSFNFKYSAAEQEELRRIRSKYINDETHGNTDALSRIRKLDAAVTSKATVAALSSGIMGTLVMGTGMSLIMTDLGKYLGVASPFFIGIAIGIIGMAGVIAAHPLYRYILKRERKKAAPEILKLSDELTKK